MCSKTQRQGPYYRWHLQTVLLCRTLPYLVWGDKWLAWYSNFEHALYVNSQMPCKDCAKVMAKYILSAAKGNTQAETDDALKQIRL